MTGHTETAADATARVGTRTALGLIRIEHGRPA